MSITVGTLEITALRELPYSHDGDSLSGRTARRWPVSCILTPADWLSLDEIYTDWRALRLADPDTMVSLDVGTTVACSGSVRGMTWEDVPAWFSAPPVPTAVGAMVGCSFELIDAEQQLAIMLREREVETQIEDDQTSIWGTYSIGDVTINLTAQHDSYEDAPTMELAATGTSVIRGPLTASRLKSIEGWTHDEDAEASLRAWYEEQIETTPAVDDYWPTSPPEVQAVPVIVAGVKVTRYLVSMTLKKAR